MVKNSRKYFLKKSRNTLDKLSIWFGSEASKTCWKTLLKVGKIDTKTSPKSYSKTGQKTHLYRHQKTSHWDQFFGQIGLSIDRPVDRPMVKFLTVGVAGRLHPKLDSVGRRPKSESGLEPFDWPFSRPPSGLVHVCTSVDRSVDWACLRLTSLSIASSLRTHFLRFLDIFKFILTP